MKPISLTLSGWGPYKGEETVDFAGMAGGGLFLITGPTGSGKTTIFDGITYALYGEVSGSIREKDSLRSDFADSGTRTYVALEFAESGKSYRIVRNPRYERPKLRGDGVTLEAENGEFTCGEELIASGSGQVTAAVEALLGLDYHQFKQISMIAQGEFQQLLVASSKDRTQVFRNIFRTRIYDTITGILSARVKVLTGKLEEVRHRAEETIVSFHFQEEEWRTLTGRKQKNFGKILLFAEESQKALKVRLGELEKGFQETDRQYRDSLIALEEARTRNRAIGKYQEDLRRLEALSLEVKELEVLVREQEKVYRALPDKRGELEGIKANIRRLEEQKRLLAEWSEKSRDLTKKQEQFIALDSVAKRRKAEYENQDDRYRMASAGILARDLREGLPCPVCGSLTHPSPAVCQDALPDEAQLKALKKNYEAAWDEATKIQQEAAGLAGELKTLELRIWPDRQNQASDQDGVRGQTRSALDGSQAFRQASEKLQEEIKKASALEKTIQDCETQYQDSRLQLEKAKSSCHQMEEGLQAPEDIRVIALGELEDSLALLDGKRKGLLKEKEQAAGRMEGNQRALASLKSHIREKEALEETYGSLRELERAANGYNNRNLVFEQYVLAVYFDQILGAANKRLSAMTSGRYELYRSVQAKDRRSREGMEMEVLDQYTGKKRSVKSLSGGEAFKAALALALGSSDVIQSYSGGIKVEALFVDEGFGALDSESLDQALTILASLTGGNRMIGIISHVEELKERLEYQIIIEKGPAGSRIKEHVG